MEELTQRLGSEKAPPETQRCLSCLRPFNSEPKIPYVRLERLKICAASSGEMPVFKLKPQKDEQDGSFLLIIECGTESSSMSIKVPLCSLWSWSLAPPREPLFSLLLSEFCLWRWPCPESGLSGAAAWPDLPPAVRGLSQHPRGSAGLDAGNKLVPRAGQSVLSLPPQLVGAVL